MRKFGTGLRSPSAFRDGALDVRDHALHLATYLKLLAHLRTRKATPLVTVAIALRAFELAQANRKDCLFCQKERSAKIAFAVARGAVNAKAPKASQATVTTTQAPSAEQRQRDEQFAMYADTPGMKPGVVYVQKTE